MAIIFHYFQNVTGRTLFRANTAFLHAVTAFRGTINTIGTGRGQRLVLCYF